MNVVVTTKPSFVKMLPALSGAPIHRTKKVWLTCVVECSPLCSISWYRNNSLLSNSTHYQVHQLGNNFFLIEDRRIWGVFVASVGLF